MVSTLYFVAEVLMIIYSLLSLLLLFISVLVFPLLPPFSFMFILSLVLLNSEISSLDCNILVAC